ncbi:MAG: GDSL-type esterase/lipase family protein [Planctomycetota bacterium]|nr:GDSL-type esterase/lipase family protein [Planctomycetota bacterium]
MRKTYGARTPLRLAIALSSGVFLAVASGEIGLRFFFPVTFDDSVILDAEGNRTPLADIVKATARSPKGEGRALSMRHCYDRPRWAYFDSEGCVSVRSNSLGLRHEEIGPRSPGDFRVLAIGDSFTFGMGVRQQDTWVKQLESLLGAQHHSQVEVINAGLAEGAHEPTRYAAWLAETGLSLQPDLVVVGFCLNDIHRSVAMAKLAPALREPWLGGRSQILLRLQLHLHRRNYERRQARNPELLKEQEAFFVTHQGGVWATRSAALVEMKERLDQRGIRFLIAILPMMTKLAGDYPYRRLHAEVRRFCEEAGIEFVDLLEPMLAFVDGLEDYSETRLWVHPTDQHPAPPAHRVFAEGIHRYLSEP